MWTYFDVCLDLQHISVVMILSESIVVITRNLILVSEISWAHLLDESALLAWK